MFKTSALLFLFLALVSCNSASAKSAPVSPVPAQALNWDAEIYYVNFTSKDQAKVEAAVALMKKVIASPEFKEAVINHTYHGDKTYVDSNGLTNEEIYQKIMDGAETIGVSTKNNKLDVELELYYQTTNTIGYTYPDTIRIWMNTKYFYKYTPVKVAGNLMHEWMHKLGFGHAMKHSRSRDYSVPYAIGYLMEKMAKKL